jgi:UDP-glucose 4-epimerase
LGKWTGSRPGRKVSSSGRKTTRKVIAITGAAGYIGQLMVRHLCQQRWVDQIVAIDINPTPYAPRTISYQLDIRQIDTLRAILAEHAATHVIHAASVTSQSIHIPIAEMYSINVVGTYQVINTAMELGIKHFTFISSAAVYGSQLDWLNFITEAATLAPQMSLSRHKAQIERYICDLPDEVRQKIAVIRPTQITGPNAPKTSLIPLWGTAAQRVFLMANGGKSFTQALHEDDAVSLIGTVVEREITGVYNAAPDDRISWREVGQLSKLPIISLPRSALKLATQFQMVVPALRGLTAEMVALLSDSLVVDNSAISRRTGWVPRYSSRQAYTSYFEAHPARLVLAS